MADRIDAAEERDEAAGAHTMVDRVLAHAAREELLAGDDAVLGGRERGRDAVDGNVARRGRTGRVRRSA